MAETLDAPDLDTDAFASSLDSALSGMDNPTPAVQVEVKKDVVQEKVEEAPVAQEQPVEEEIDLKASLTSKKDEPEKKTEDDKAYPPGIFSAKARENFDIIKGQREEQRKRADALEAEVKALKANSGLKAPEVSVLTKERDEARAKIAEYEKELAATHIERTEEFKNSVTVPGRQAVEGIKALETQYKLSSTDISSALEEPDEFLRNDKLEEIAEGITSQLSRNKFYKLAEQYVTAKEKEAELYANAAGSMEFAETKRKEEEAAAKIKAADEYKNALTGVLEHVGKPLQDLQSDSPVWDKIRADSEGQSIEEMSPTDKAFAIMASNAITPLLKKLNAVKKELADLKGVQQARTRATPGAGPTPTSPQAPKDDRDFMDVLGDALG